MLRSGSALRIATCSARDATSGAFCLSVMERSARSAVPLMWIAGASASIEKRTLRSVESRPPFTITGTDAGAYDAIRGTSSPSSVTAISESRDCEKGLVRPVIESGEPSMRACSEGVT